MQQRSINSLHFFSYLTLEFKSCSVSMHIAHTTLLTTSAGIKIWKHMLKYSILCWCCMCNAMLLIGNWIECSAERDDNIPNLIRKKNPDVDVMSILHEFIHFLKYHEFEMLRNSYLNENVSIGVYLTDVYEWIAKAMIALLSDVLDCSSR